MDSEPVDASKNTCLQQTSCSTKPLHLMCQCGLWAWICRRHLIRSNGKIYARSQRTWSVRSYVVGFAMHLWWPNGANWRQQYWWRSILYQGRRATRMCIESAVVLVCSGSGPWMLASEGWQCWRGFSGWHAHTLGFKIRRRYPSFCQDVWGNNIFVGRTGDMFGRSGAATECAKNKSTDNSVTKSQRGASSKWTSNWGVRPWLYA